VADGLRKVGGRFSLSGWNAVGMAHWVLKMARRWLLLPIAFVVSLNPSTATAQSILDRVVGTDRERPLIITELREQTVGTLAGAAGVPMGFETAPMVPRVQPWRVAATGRTVREVADAIVAADPRYEWREDNGVLLFRPRAAWEGGPSLLDARIAGLKLDDIEAADAMSAIRRLFGASDDYNGFPDTHRFSVDVPAGSTRLDALNAIVRAHGTLAWALERTSGRALNDNFAFSVFLIIGGQGTGVGIPRSAHVLASLPGEDVTPRTRAPRGDRVPLLDRIVGPDRTGRALRMYGISGESVARLAAAAGVPMGVQMLSPALPRVALAGFQGSVMTGMPLRVALDMLASLDARYEWREMDGVVVFRPVSAWNDPNDPLFRLAPDVQLHDVPTSKVIGVLLSTLGRLEPNPNFPDTRPLSVDVPQGSVLHLLNAMARAHGELSWEWAELGAAERQLTGGLRHSLMFFMFSGGGFGWMLP